MDKIVIFQVLAIYFLGCVLHTSLGLPVANRDPRQLSFNRKPDGTLVASFSAANAFDGPGFDSSAAMSQTIEIGPNGMSSSGSQAFNSDVLGNRMSFANSQASAAGLGGGFSAANAAANSFSNPLFSGGNSQANAFGGGGPSFGGGPGFGGPLGGGGLANFFR